MTFKELASEFRNLQEKFSEVVSINSSLESRIKHLEEQNSSLRRQLFGRKSERRPVPDDQRQPSLFELALSEEKEDEEAQQSLSERIEVPAHSRNRGNKSSSEEAPEGTFPAHLRRVEQVYDSRPEGIADDELELAQAKITERLCEEPSEQYVLRIVRKVYKLKSTGEFHVAALPKHPLGRCKVDESFLVMMVIKKFLWHLPLHRQHKMLALEGIYLNRGQMAEWVIKLAKLLSPIAETLKRELLAQGYLYVDETPSRVGRGKQKKGKKYGKGHFWPLLVPEVGIVFEYHAGRSHEAFTEMVGDYRGTLISDAYEVYEKHIREHKNAWQLCMMHSRRNFVEAESSHPAAAKEALEFFRTLYRIEKEIKERGIDSPRKISEIRQQHSLPVLKEFKEWLRRTAATPEALTDENLAKACSYMLKRWDAVCLFVQDGRLAIDNSVCERALRCVKLGQNNWLFCASELGAQAAATFYSLIASAMLHGVHPYHYLLDVTKRITEGVDPEELVPHRWKERFAAEVLPTHLTQQA